MNERPTNPEAKANNANKVTSLKPFPANISKVVIIKAATYIGSFPSILSFEIQAAQTATPREAIAHICGGIPQNRATIITIIGKKI